jgi:hypothetical protein
MIQKGIKLRNLTYQELKKIAQHLQIPKYYILNKQELIKEILAIKGGS